jgi:hypothetical protein
MSIGGDADFGAGPLPEAQPITAHMSTSPSDLKT